MAVNAACALVAAALVLASGSAAVVAIATTAAPLLTVAWLVVETTRVARSARQTPAPARFVVPLGERPSLGAYPSAPMLAAHAAVLVVPSAVFALILDRLPARVPMHWNAAGQVDRYDTPAALWVFLGIMGFDAALGLGIAWAMARERWALPPEGAERYAALQLERRRMLVRLVDTLILGINASVAALWLAIALSSLPGLSGLLGLGIALSTAALVAGLVGPMLRYMGPLARLQDELRAIAGSDVLGTHPSGWKGFFYFAPDDPAVFVPKRHGIGQTLNFARPAAWLFLIGLVVVPLALAALTRLAAR
jgi:uncharacterized membrane protein